MIDSSLLQNMGGYVDGAWISEAGRDSIDVKNPATGELLARVPSLANEEVVQAIESADRAWQVLPTIVQRIEWLSSIAELILSNREELGRIISTEHGKPWREAITEAEYAASFFEFYSQHTNHLQPRILDKNVRNHQWTVFARPAGVAALISPWNFPLAMMAKKLSAALAAGCGCVVRPSSKTPLTMIALFSLIDSLDLPNGMVNLILGSATEFSRIVCQHPAVRVISFTGSTPVGRELMEHCAPQLKRLSFELGGHAPFIVFEDAEIELCVEALIQNKFRGTGQTCVCANRVFVHRRILDEFAESLKTRIEQLKLGNGLEPDTDIGPLIDANALAKVERHVKDAVAQGAICLSGGNRSVPRGCDSAAPFYAPTILQGVTSTMACFREETFGPVIPLIEFGDENEVIQAANATEFGLAAYLFTADQARASRIISRLRFGHVGRNTGTGPVADAPFGGMKQSGFGREGGVEGMHDFLEYQTVPSRLES